MCNFFIFFWERGGRGGKGFKKMNYCFLFLVVVVVVVLVLVVVVLVVVVSSPPFSPAYIPSFISLKALTKTHPPWYIKTQFG